MKKWSDTLPSECELGVGTWLNETPEVMSTSLSAALYQGDKASVILLKATVVPFMASGLLTLCLDSSLCVSMKERKPHKVIGERREREGGFGVSWLTGRQHMARLVFLSVFCLCLRASCLSQAGRGAAETGSLMRHRGRSEGEERRRNGSD